MQTADGVQVWQHEETEGWLEAAALSGSGVFALVVRTTAQTPNCTSSAPCTATNDVIHAHAIGLDVATGAMSWRFDM